MIADDNIEESIREKLKEQQHIADCVGTISYNHFEIYKDNAVRGMVKFGGFFIQALGLALEQADDINSVKLMNVWRSAVSEHEMLYRIWKAKEEARGVNVKGCVLETAKEGS